MQFKRIYHTCHPEKNRANKSRKIFHAIEIPSVDDLKSMIRLNLTKNNEVDTDDINPATKAFSLDISEIKGKTMRRKPALVVNNIVELPDELININQDVTLSINSIIVNSLKFLSTISYNLYYRTAQHISNITASLYEVCMSKVINACRRRGFSIA